MASVSTPEAGQVPGREQPSYGQGVSDGAGPGHARHLFDVLRAQNDVGAGRGGLRHVGLPDHSHGDP